MILNKKTVGKFDKRKYEYYTMIYIHLMEIFYICTNCDKKFHRKNVPGQVVFNKI